jgi:hypothetical protein
MVNDEKDDGKKKRWKVVSRFTSNVALTLDNGRSADEPATASVTQLRDEAPIAMAATCVPSCTVERLLEALTVAANTSLDGPTGSETATTWTPELDRLLSSCPAVIEAEMSQLAMKAISSGCSVRARLSPPCCTTDGLCPLNTRHSPLS